MARVWLALPIWALRLELELVIWQVGYWGCGHGSRTARLGQEVDIDIGCCYKLVDSRF